MRPYDTATEQLPTLTDTRTGEQLKRDVGWPFKSYWVGSFEDDMTELGLRAFAFEVQENDLWWPHYTDEYWNPPAWKACRRCGGSGIEP